MSARQRMYEHGRRDGGIRRGVREHELGPVVCASSRGIFLT